MIPRRPQTAALLLAAVAAAAILPAAHALGASPARFVQDRFAIGFWVDPPADKDMDAHYRRIAPVLDDSPAMDGLQVSLDAGEGRLFLLPAR